MTKTQQDILYGYLRRSAKSQDQRKQALQYTKELCQNAWDAFVEENQYSEAITDEQIYDLYESIYKEIEKNLSAHLLPFALFERMRFFDKVNEVRQKRYLPLFPKPIIAVRPQRPKNINDFDEFLYLPKAQNIVTQAFNTWQKKNTFSVLDCVSWFLFSLVSFAGYNDEKMLKAIYEYLKDSKPIYQLFDDMLIMPLRLLSPDYGNEVTPIEGGRDEVYQTRLIIIDDISRLWLLKLQHQRQAQSDFPKYRQIIQRLGEFVGENFTVKSIHKSNYLQHIAIYWQTLPDVYLDIQLVQVLTGQQKQTSISTSQLLRYFQSIKTPKVVLSDEHVSKLMIGPSTSNNGDNALDAVKVERFRSDAVKEIRTILNNDKKQVQPQLVSLLTQNLYPNQQRLVRWMLDLCINGRKINTLKRYLSEIGNGFIAGTRTADFLQWSKHDYHYIYNEIIAEKNPNKLGYTKTVICSLHDSLKKYNKAPEIDIRGGGDAQIVSSYLIPQKVYHTILDCIAEQQVLSAYYKQALSIVIILLYRTGMRISEILGLQVTDIEYDNQSFTEYNVIVRPNAHRDLKSDDGTRRIYLSVLLLSEELEDFKRFFHLKKRQSSRYLFTLAYQSSVMSRYSIEQPLKRILENTAYHDITLHSFRHNAISNMALILRCNPMLVMQFTDYDEIKIYDIKTHFLGRVRSVSTNYWAALMEFAGHADLITTFSSYIHTADIVASHQLQQAKLTLPLDVVNKLIGTSRMDLKQHNKNALESRDNAVNLNRIRQYVNRKVDCEKLVLANEANIPLSSNSSIDTDKKQYSTVFGRYSREMIEKLLWDIEDGQTLGEASSLNFRYDDALMIYERAVSLVKDTEGNLNHKLISKKRKQRSDHILLAPTPLHYHEEQALVNLCFNNLEKLYEDKEGRRKVKEMLQVFYEKVNSSKSEIRFTFKQKKNFYKYLSIMCQILPSRHWRVNISFLKSEPYLNENNKNVYRSVVDKPAKRKKMEEFEKDMPEFEGDLIHLDTYNGYSLTLISPLQKKGSTKLSSALMSHVLHFLLIVDGLTD
ncbi:site-specific integrase [Psychrobacter sp. Pi2-1]|uniref:site-specific integrase n=1 Tax=Psychrobacter sp. Pi2-1 TaxID=2774131 RepID=UPI001919DD3D|nr:site-specific integrase [Psychrobacter sp. Pi2-1]